MYYLLKSRTRLYTLLGKEIFWAHVKSVILMAATSIIDLLLLLLLLFLVLMYKGFDVMYICKGREYNAIHCKIDRFYLVKNSWPLFRISDGSLSSGC